MNVLYLFNGVKKHVSLEAISKRETHDGQWFGMLRLKQFGINAEYRELEDTLPESFAGFLRHNFFTMHYAHIPLMPFFSRADVVFTSTAYGSMLIHAGLRSIGIKGPKWVVLDFNLSGTIGDAKTIREKLFRYALSKVDGIVTISQAEKNLLDAQFPDLIENIVFIREGVDTEFFKPMPEVAEENYILSVGKDPGRDFKTLIEATENLPREVKLIIATRPERLKELEPLPAHVEVRSYSPKEIIAAYAKAKLVVVPLSPKGEGDSMGTLSVEEAMAMGKAVIATRSESMASYIEENVSGITVPKGNVGVLAAAIKKLLDDSQERVRLGNNARSFVVEKCSADHFAKELAAFLTKVVKK